MFRNFLSAVTARLPIDASWLLATQEEVVQRYDCIHGD